MRRTDFGIAHFEPSTGGPIAICRWGEGIPAYFLRRAFRAGAVAFFRSLPSLFLSSGPERPYETSQSVPQPSSSVD